MMNSSGKLTLSRRALMPMPVTAGFEKVFSIPAVGCPSLPSSRGNCSVLADRRRDHAGFFELAFPFPPQVIPCCGLSIVERADEEAGFFPKVGRLSVDAWLTGDPKVGGEFAREDRSERRESENELSLRLCLGMSTDGVDTSVGPSTPVLTIYVFVSGFDLGGLTGLCALVFSSVCELSLCDCPLCNLLRTNDPTRFPRPTFSGDCCST